MLRQLYGASGVACDLHTSCRTISRVRAQTVSRVQLSVTPWTVAGQAPLSLAFPRPEYRSGLPFPPPGDLADAGIKPASPVLAGGFFTTDPPGKPK